MMQSFNTTTDLARRLCVTLPLGLPLPALLASAMTAATEETMTTMPGEPLAGKVET